MLRVENPKHGKTKRSSNCRVPKERDWRRTKFFLRMWDRVPDHIEQNGHGGGKEQGK
jgi:hypothetical protein